MIVMNVFVVGVASSGGVIRLKDSARKAMWAKKQEQLVINRTIRRISKNNVKKVIKVYEKRHREPLRPLVFGKEGCCTHCGHSNQRHWNKDDRCTVRGCNCSDWDY